MGQEGKRTMANSTIKVFLQRIRSEQEQSGMEGEFNPFLPTTAPRKIFFFKSSEKYGICYLYLRGSKVGPLATLNLYYFNEQRLMCCDFSYPHTSCQHIIIQLQPHPAKIL